MVQLTRRSLLVSGAGVAAVGGLAASGVLTWEELHRRAGERAPDAGTGTVVLVTLYGGNDGLSTLVPYADPAYHDARPDLAFTADQVQRLDDRYGLNPEMKGLAGLFHANKLAIVRGVGYPKPDRSHFRSMDIWQTASPSEPVPTGWIGRWLDSTGDDPVRALNIGATVPALAVGAKTSAAALSLAGIPKTSLAASAKALGAADHADTPAMATVRTSYRSAQIVGATFAGPAGEKDDGAADRTNPLARQLDLVARCILAGVPTRIYSVSLGGFDTHSAERDTQHRLLGAVDTALTAFHQRMQADPRGRGTVVMMYTEFGRRVHANASEGTDHGTAGPVFVLGDTVRGGFHGDEPSLTDLDQGDLKYTVDFRDVYHELLSKGIGADPTPSVGAGRRDVGFLA
ncbi:DUF1501 domain-containing protein [Tsukamurella sp. NPDC003166]|uniref:DUF1501 domain-containing protein n=1 Tax=Tsukamurella sp. NPDC003166 TaxID=3154444 RepID=UPI0033AB2CEE